MKRPFLILLAGVVGVAIILFLRPKPPITNEPSVLHESAITNTPAIAEITNSLNTKEAPQVDLTNIVHSEPKQMLDVAKTQSLADWTNAIPKIKQWSHFRERSSWVAAPVDTNSYSIILLTGVNGSTVQFTSKLTSVDAMGNDVQKIELHTPNMDIDGIRELGLQLCSLQGLDSTDFLAWCNKVGNQSVDAPSYDGKSLNLPNSNKFYGFGVHQTFNSEKPWYILFFVTSR